MQILSPSRRAKLTAAIQAMTSPSSYPTVSLVPAYWYDAEVNFGDLVTPELLRAEGLTPICKPGRTARIAGAGSVIELVGDEFSGFIWGSGKMHPDRFSDVSRATVLGVRGALTREVLGLPADTLLGDPGLLLAHEYALSHSVTGPIGILPHMYHREDPTIRRLLALDGTVEINVAQTPRAVAAAIASCRALLTTSLHGLVFADAIGVPVLWGMPPASLPGGDFKFRDYLSTVQEDPSGRRATLDSTLTLETIEAGAAPAEPEMLALVLHQLRTSREHVRSVLPTITIRTVAPLIPVYQFLLDR